MSDVDGSQAPLSGWVQRVMDTGLLGPQEVAQLMKGDFRPMVAVLPQLMGDPEFRSIPQIQGLIAQLSGAASGEQATAPAQAPAPIEDRRPRADRRTEEEPQVEFSTLGNDFGTRLCALLANPKFGGQLQINFQFTSRGVVFQVCRFVRNDAGKVVVEPFSNAVPSDPRELGDWIKAVLKQSAQELRTMAEDADMLEPEDDDTLPPLPQQQAPPRRRVERQG